MLMQIQYYCDCLVLDCKVVCSTIVDHVPYATIPCVGDQR
jgi:hypothetical protein